MHEVLLFLAKQTVVVTLFIGYLFVVCCVSVIRVLRLGRLHYSLDRRHLISLETLSAGAATANNLAEAVLANRALYEPSLRAHRNSEMPAKADDEKAVLRTIRIADTRFMYLWEMSDANIQSTKRLVLLTILFSLVVAVCGATSILRGEFMTEAKSIGIVQLVKAIFEQVWWLAFGLVVSTMLYILSSFLEGMLARRKINWKYLVARLRDDLSVD